ncbi:hypothetical protein FRC03_002081 [Tulasnella sp. 419]|nr:hypothetical protein FRC02_001535 [Tulasnella sp. 418]KAG8944415.1 hypothetical protein FRC03_002081 [Tulasnella sp. 419]
MHPPVGITAGMDSLTAGKPNPGSIPMKKRDVGHSRSSSRASHTSHGSISSVSSVNRGPMRWRKRGRRVRQYGAEILDWVDAHGRMEGSHDIVWGLGGMKSVGVEDYHSDGNEGDKEDSDREEVAPVKISLQIDEPPAVVDTSSGDTLVDPILETRSVSSGSSTRSYLTPNLPSAAEKRRSMRLARRSSGGDTIMPYYQAEEDEEAFDNTPTKRRSDMSIA